jgi:DNA-binding NtrC family response regulator
MPTKKGRKRILVVNDTEEILELFQAIVEGMGHEMIPMSYAPDDLAKITEARPDLVIVDFVMAGEEFRGWQLVQKLKMSRDTEELPLIICTGAKREIHEYEGWLTEKGIAVVLKPFSIDDLEKAIDKTLRNPDLRAARARGDRSN